MRKKVLFLAALLFVTTFVSPVSALPRDDLYIGYYNCEMELIGEYYKDCWGGIYGWGSQSGDFKQEVAYPCSGIGDPSTNWFEWSGGSWHAVSGTPTGCALDLTETYYCYPSETGTHYVSCTGAVSDSGLLAGSHKHVVRRRCSDNGVDVDQWYVYNWSSGTWSAVSGPPSPGTPSVC